MITNPTLQHDPRMSEWCVAAKRTLMQWMEMLKDEGVDERERETWTHHTPAWRRAVADAFGVRFVFGAHRVVFVQNPFVIKIDRGEGNANFEEWNRWKKLTDEAKQHVFTPYCITDCGTVLVGELLRMWNEGAEMFVVEKQQARIFEEWPEIRRIPDSGAIENWGLRGDKAVLLDCAGYC